MLQKDCVRKDNARSVESCPYIIELRDHTLSLPSLPDTQHNAGTALCSWIVFTILESCPVSLPDHEKLFRPQIQRPG